MKTSLTMLLGACLLLGVAIPETTADETVILSCSSLTGFTSGPFPSVVGCGTSAGVPISCPAPPPNSAPCAQFLADFLSLPGYKLVDVQGVANSNVVYTIVKRARGD